MAKRKPPVLVVDFLDGGLIDGIGTVYLRRKGGESDELKLHIKDLLEWQHASLSNGMKVWLVDLDGDISGTAGLPLAATVEWHDDLGWAANYRSEDAESE